MPIVSSIIAGLAVNGLTRLAKALGPDVRDWRTRDDVERAVNSAGELSSLVADAAASMSDGVLPDGRPLDDLLQQSSDLVAELFEAYLLDPPARDARLADVYAVFLTRFQREFSDLPTDAATSAARVLFDRLVELSAKLCGVSIQTGALPKQNLHIPDPGPEPDMEVGHFLCMDIVGFSKASSARQVALLGALTGIVHGTETYTRAVAGGRILALPTGDGMFLTFLGAAVQVPLKCAVEIAKKIRDEHPSIHLRMGAHQGPVYHTVDINKGANVTGHGANMAQRVMDCGDAGHILVSHDAAATLLREDDWGPPTYTTLASSKLSTGSCCNSTVCIAMA